MLLELTGEFLLTKLEIELEMGKPFKGT